MLVGTAMGAGATTTKEWSVGLGHFNLNLYGSFETSTLTVEASPNAGATWYTYVAYDATGTPAAQQFTVTHVPNATSLFSVVVFGHGLRFRATTNSTGTTPSINVDLVGENVQLYDA